MKKIIFTLAFLFLVSCGKDDSNNSAPPIITPVTPTETYQYKIREMNAYDDIICSTGAIRTFNSFQAMCASIMTEYEQGRCDRACSKLLYESVNCGQISIEYDSFSCGNHYLRSSQSY